MSSLLPLTWLRPDRLLHWDDSFFALTPGSALSQGLKTWSIAGAPGYPNNQVPLLPFYAAETVLSDVGIPPGVLEVTILVMLSVAATFGTYSLAQLTIASCGTRVNPIAAQFGSACAGIIWVASPLALGAVWYKQTFLEWTWAILPWILRVVTAAAYASPRPRWHYFASSLALGLLGSPGLLEAYLPGISLLLVLWLLPAFYWSVQKHTLANLLPVASAVAGLIVSIFWWLLPALPFIKSELATTTTSPASTVELAAYSPYLSVWKILSLTDAPFLWQRLAPGEPRYAAWAGILSPWPLGWIAYLVPLLTIGGLLLLRRLGGRLSDVIVGALLSLFVGVLVTKGHNEPFPELGLLLLKLPYGSAFRVPVTTLAFVASLPLCILFGVAVAAVSATKKRWRALVVGGILLYQCTISLAWWKGAVLPGRVGPIPSAYVKVPSYYERLTDTLKRLSGTEKVLVLPYSPYSQTVLDWPSGGNLSPDCFFPGIVPKDIFLCGDINIGLANIPGTILATDLKEGESGTTALAWLWGVSVWIDHLDWNYLAAPNTLAGVGSSTLLHVFTTRPLTSPRLMQRFSSPDLAMYTQRALPLTYLATTRVVTRYSVSDRLGITRLAEALRAKRPVVVSAASARDMRCAGHISLSDVAADGMTGVLSGHGSACLVFGETFNDHLVLEVRGAAGGQVRHFVANWWENGWTLRVYGRVAWRVVYLPTRNVRYGVAIGLVEWIVLLLGCGALTVRQVAVKMVPIVERHCR